MERLYGLMKRSKDKIDVSDGTDEKEKRGSTKSRGSRTSSQDSAEEAWEKMQHALNQKDELQVQRQILVDDDSLMIYVLRLCRC